MKFSLTRIFATATLALFAGGAFAQDSANRVGDNTDWFVFVESDPTQCWSVSSPKETINTDAQGRIKSVRRGDILLFVSFAPSANVKGQVSFQGGYPFANGSTVEMDIGGTTFEMFTEGETAWSTSEADDSKIVAAMKRGAKATLTGRSSRGTVTKDTFSLLGFTASYDDAAARCGG